MLCSSRATASKRRVPCLAPGQDSLESGPPPASGPHVFCGAVPSPGTSRTAVGLRMCGAGSPATHELVVPRSMPITSFPVAKRLAEELQVGAHRQEAAESAQRQAAGAGTERGRAWVGNPPGWKPAHGAGMRPAAAPAAPGLRHVCRRAILRAACKRCGRSREGGPQSSKRRLAAVAAPWRQANSGTIGARYRRHRHNLERTSPQQAAGIRVWPSRRSPHT